MVKEMLWIVSKIKIVFILCLVTSAGVLYAESEGSISVRRSQESNATLTEKK